MGKLVVAAVTAGVAAFTLAAPVGADELQVRLHVTEPAGLARKGEPICGGIPLPKGMFRKDQPFAMLRAEGLEELACQTVPLVADPDGTVRWILVDFQDDLAAGAAGEYVLRPGRAEALPPRPVKVASGADAVTVDTGRVRFTISRTEPFGLFSSAEAGGRRAVSGGRISYTDGFDGKTYPAGAPTEVNVELAGPMRATVVARGRFQGDEKNRLQYIARITAWAGKSFVHVKYSLANSNPDHYCYRAVKESAIELKLARRPTGSVLGAGKPLSAGPEAWLAQHLRAGAEGAAEAGSGGKQIWVSKGSTDSAQGWIAARAADSTVWACDLYFADDPARRLAVKDGRLILSGIVQRQRSPRKDRRGREIGAPYAGTQRFLYDCSHLTSQYLIDLGAGGEHEQYSQAAARARNRLWLLAAPEWYLHRTRAMPYGAFGTQADELRCYDTWGWKYDRKDIPARPRRRYGRFHPGIDNHYRPEEDPLDQLLIMYLRSGKRPYFDAARSWANYWMDLYAWRTDGWRYKDGGVWWYTGPKGNRPQRPPDPVTGSRNHIPAPWAKTVEAPWTAELVRDAYFLANSKSCYCHNWGQGLLAWYCLTGDGDALAAALDRVEQDIDTQRRAFRKRPGTTDDFSRDFNRASYLAHAARMIAPGDEFVRDASDFLAAVHLRRPTREPRGLVNAANRWRRPAKLETFVGQQGLAALAESGNKIDARTGQMTDPRTGRTWYVILNPHTWMFPPLSRAMELYYRLTGDEDALDWTIAYGQAAARVLYQQHGLLTYGRMLADFPARGVVRDWASWVAPPGSSRAEGLVMSGYLARFHPDVCARAYELCGEPILKQRAYDYWLAGSHRGYRRKEMMPLDRVGMWVDYHSDHDGQTDFVGRTFHIWAHPRKHAGPPAPVTDLKVTVAGDKASISFTAPADIGGGKVARYQVKCADKPIVEYEKFLSLYNDFKDDQYCNWWMATNLAGEPAPKAPGARESFTVTAVPTGAGYFAVRSFDEADNRSRLSNVAAPAARAK